MKSIFSLLYAYLVEFILIFQLFKSAIIVDTIYIFHAKTGFFKHNIK